MPLFCLPKGLGLAKPSSRGGCGDRLSDNALLHQLIGQLGTRPMADGATLLLWRGAGQGIALRNGLYVKWVGTPVEAHPGVDFRRVAYVHPALATDCARDDSYLW